MTAFIDVQITGDERQVMGMLNSLHAAMAPQAIAQFLSVIILPYLRQRIRERFQSEGDEATGPWASLAEATREVRASGIASGAYFGITPSHPINVRTGSMERYLTQVNSVPVITSESVTLNFPGRQIPMRDQLRTKIERAQTGDARTPARPVLGLSERDLFFTVGALAQHIATFARLGRV